MQSAPALALLPSAELIGACWYLKGFSPWAEQRYMGSFLERAIPPPNSMSSGPRGGFSGRVL